MMSLLFLAACSAPPATDATADDTGAVDYVDKRMTPADYAAAPAEAALLTGADVVVEPGQDGMWCLAGTYTGPDAGIVALQTYQANYGHHLQLYGTTLSTLDLADGERWDCTDSSDLPMDDLEPIAFTTESNNGGAVVVIPDGFAVKLDENQRWVLQSHYVNVGDEPMRVQDVAAIQTVDPDSVGTWAAPLFLNHSRWELAPGETTRSEFEVVLEQELNVLVLLGHMHEWGTTFSTSIVDAGIQTPIYEVETWEATFRDAPPTNSYAPGELTLAEGTTIRMSCEWFNETDAPVVFPHEMCVTAGLVYPFRGAVGYSD